MTWLLPMQVVEEVTAWLALPRSPSGGDNAESTHPLVGKTTVAPASQKHAANTWERWFLMEILPFRQSCHSRVGRR